MPDPCLLDPGLCYPSTWQPPSPDPWQHWQTGVAQVHGVRLRDELIASALVVLVLVVKFVWASIPRGRHE